MSANGIVSQKVFKKWIFTFHAKERMWQRRITPEEIKEVVTKPDEILHQKDKLIIVKNVEGRNDNAIAVVLAPSSGTLKQEDLWVIVTVMVNFHTL